MNFVNFDKKLPFDIEDDIKYQILEQYENEIKNSGVSSGVGQIELKVKNTLGVSAESINFNPEALVHKFMRDNPLFANEFQYDGFWKLQPMEGSKKNRSSEENIIFIFRHKAQRDSVVTFQKQQYFTENKNIKASSEVNLD